MLINSRDVTYLSFCPEYRHFKEERFRVQRFKTFLYTLQPVIYITTVIDTMIGFILTFTHLCACFKYCFSVTWLRFDLYLMKLNQPHVCLYQPRPGPGSIGLVIVYLTVQLLLTGERHGKSGKLKESD
jgi:hypothetical protein